LLSWKRTSAKFDAVRIGGENVQIKDEMEWLLDEYAGWVDLWHRDHNASRILDDALEEREVALSWIRINHDSYCPICE
jgi:hypothetical protein